MRQLTVLVVVDVLDIQHHQVRVLHQLLELAKKWLFASERTSGSIDRGVDALSL